MESQTASVEKPKRSLSGFWLPAMLVACVASTLLLSLSIGRWWSHQQNHIFGNANWVVGKDSGKFVFYTYNWMFRPIHHGQVDLAEDMGYQKLLYSEPENATRQLDQLALDFQITKESYLWVILHESENSSLRIRLSNSARHRNGFYRYDEQGQLAAFTPFDQNPKISEAWHRLQVTRDPDETWHLSRDGLPLGRIPIPQNTEGAFGFQGSGRGNSHVMLRNIDLRFSLPGTPTKAWDVHERFTPNPLDRNDWSALTGLAAFLIFLRLARAHLLASLFGLRHPASFILRDIISCTVVLGVANALKIQSSGIHIPGAMLLAELFTLIWLARAKRAEHPMPPAGKWVIIYTALALITISIAITRHGEWLGRASRQIWSKMEAIDPAAFTISPNQTAPSPAFRQSEPVVLTPGKPFFPKGAVYREQDIEFTLHPVSNLTFDVVFQQQSYFNRGDPDGEPLPLQRNLIRLSTRDDTPTGLGTGTLRKPAPFFAMEGKLIAGTDNTVRIHVARNALEIVLNGTRTTFPRFTTLDYGETGFMVYEPSATIRDIDIRPLGLPGPKRPLFILSGIGLAGLSMGLFAGIAWLFTRMSWTRGCLFGLSALFMPLVYLGLTCLLNSERLAFLGRTRLLWMDIGLVGLAVGLLFLLAVPAATFRRKPLFFNLAFPLVFAAILSVVWDSLPADHPLRLRYSSEAVAPADADAYAKNPKLPTGPWYTNNRRIGSNNYVWHQRFGARRIPQQKPEGQIRLFAMGGSQAWGSGAADSSSTWDALLKNNLHERGHTKIDIFNASVNGAGIATVRDVYLEVLRHFQPDGLLLDVGLNDSAALVRDRTHRDEHRARMVEAMVQILDDCQAKNIPVILALEAMSRESPLRPDKKLYAAYADAARARGFEVIEVMKVTVPLEDDFPVWWDTAHYAPYGHRLLARLLTPVVEQVFTQE